ncbi:oligosaccharide flippase family protein [Scandinavium sp. M-37]|uniref:oligosaccharide flippase family protein n=1 Tax=Scandinavium sp. M-37 TaxID=3373077 RepID=UPI003747545A
MLRLFNREFLSNFIGLSSINVLGMLIPIVTMPYLSRVLGAEGYGIVLLFSTLSISMMIIIDYSTNITGVRECALNTKNSNQLTSVYIKYQGIRLLLTFLFIPLSIIYCYYFFANFDFLFYLELLSVSAIGYYLSAPWFHQGTSTLAFFSFITISTRLIQLLLLFVFVRDADSIHSAMRLNAYAFMATGIILAIFRYYRMNVKSLKSYRFSLQNFKEGFDAFIGEFSPNLYSNIPPLVIGAMVSPVVFACYSIALRITNIAGSFQSIAAKSVYPMVVKGSSSLKALFAINLLFALVPFLLILTFGHEVVNLFLGEGYEEAYWYLLLCSPGIILYSFLCSFSYGYFLPKKMDSIFKKISLISSVIPALIGYPLMHFYGATGAILMLLLARTLFALLYFYYYLKLK